MRTTKQTAFIIVTLCLLLGTCQANSAKEELDQFAPLNLKSPINKEIVHSNNRESYTQQRFDTRSSQAIDQAKTSPSSSFKRVEKRKSSVIGDIVIGSILFFAGFPCLWFNEKGYAYTKTFLHKYVKECIPVRSEEIDPNNQNKLICAQGTTVTTEIITDSEFGIQVNNSIKLSRFCEGFQWEETRSSTRVSNDEDEVTYSYKTVWASSFIESRDFAESGHDNYSQDWLFEAKKFDANLVTYGAFKLTQPQKDQCCKQESIPITQQTANLIASKGGFNLGNTNNFMGNVPNAPPPPYNNPANPLGDSSFNNSSNNFMNNNQNQNYNNFNNSNFMNNNQGQYNTNQGGNYNSNLGYGGNNFGPKTISIQGNYLYFKKNQYGETPGDFRVSFNRTPCGPITVIGRQSFDCIETFQPEVDKQNDINSSELEDGGCCGCCGLVCKVCEVINSPISEINWVKEDTSTKSQIFQEKLSMYETKTWLMRLAGFCCFMFGVYFMLSPVYTLLYWFPLVGRYLGTFGEFICGLVGFLIAIPLSILTISIAWLFYRKEIGIPLLLVALIIIGYFTYTYKRDYKGEEGVPAF